MTRTDSEPLSVTPPEGVTVVPYDVAQHHDLIPGLYASSFNEQPWPADWEQIPEFDPNGVFLATSATSKEFIGFVVSFQRQNFGYISVVGVLPQWRRQGIASLLIATAARYLISKHLDFLQIDVEANNVAARKAYEKLGFRVIKSFEG